MLIRRLIALAAAIAALAVDCPAADPLEGRWQVNGGGALVDIVPTAGNSGALTMTWVDGAELDIEPGTKVAEIYPSHKPGVYDCHAVADPRRQGVAKSKGKSVDFVIKFEDGMADAVTFEAYRRNRRISLWRWLPYFFRVTVINESNRPDNLEGANRVDSAQKRITI